MVWTVSETSNTLHIPLAFIINVLAVVIMFALITTIAIAIGIVALVVILITIAWTSKRHKIMGQYPKTESTGSTRVHHFGPFGDPGNAGTS